MKTIDYYNQYADEFIQATFNVEMENLYQPFLAQLAPSAVILDVGCGSGRDSLAFKNKGYQVDAIDHSEQLVKKATELTGIAVQLKSFYQIDAVETYDGIWACASLLHCERARLVEVIGKLIIALKPQGVLYLSFKYGQHDRQQHGREFTDIDEHQAAALLAASKGVQLLDQWVSLDQRPEREEQWMNLLWKKQV